MSLLVEIPNNLTSKGNHWFQGRRLWSALLFSKTQPAWLSSTIENWRRSQRHTREKANSSSTGLVLWRHSSMRLQIPAIRYSVHMDLLVRLMIGWNSIFNCLTALPIRSVCRILWRYASKCECAFDRCYSHGTKQCLFVSFLILGICGQTFVCFLTGFWLNTLKSPVWAFPENSSVIRWHLWQKSKNFFARRFLQFLSEINGANRGNFWLSTRAIGRSKQFLEEGIPRCSHLINKGQALDRNSWDLRAFWQWHSGSRSSFWHRIKDKKLNFILLSKVHSGGSFLQGYNSWKQGFRRWRWKGYRIILKEATKCFRKHDQNSGDFCLRWFLMAFQQWNLKSQRYKAILFVLNCGFLFYSPSKSILPFTIKQDMASICMGKNWLFTTILLHAISSVHSRLGHIPKLSMCCSSLATKYESKQTSMDNVNISFQAQRANPLWVCGFHRQRTSSWFFISGDEFWKFIRIRYIEAVFALCLSPCIFTGPDEREPVVQ